MPEPPSRSLFPSTGGGLLRSPRLVRAPVWMYRARAGALFGSRIDHPSADVYVVASGFGRKAQWLSNIQANPRVPVLEDTLGERITDTDTPLPMVELRLD